jgi:hypothetical protein
MLFVKLVAMRSEEEEEEEEIERRHQGQPGRNVAQKEDVP